MRSRQATLIAAFALFSLVLLPRLLYAASAPSKVVFTFGGLSERSGVLFVGKDAGIFQKHGLDAQVVNVRSGPVGMAALAYNVEADRQSWEAMLRLFGEVWR